MRLVQFTRDMRPWRSGDAVPLTDELARRLVAEDEAIDKGPWPAAPVLPLDLADDAQASRSRRQNFRTK